MNKNSLIEKIREFLPTPKDVYNFKLEVRKVNKNIEIEYGQMYEAIDISFNQAVQLRDLFDAKDITRELINMSGCESCDFGSFYGETITVVLPQKNNKFEGILFEDKII